MTVRSMDGEKLGKVIALGEQDFQIEKGIFFPKDYLASYSAISDIREDEIILSQGAESLRRPEELSGAERRAGREGITETRAEEELRVPLHEEQLEVDKRSAEAGRVMVTKEVVEEQQQVSVPIERERVRVEQVPASGAATDARFEGGTVSIPLKEEEVEVRKRPVVREEVRLQKEREVEHRAVEDTVRREEAHISSEGEVERPIERGEPKDPLKRS